MLKHHAYSVNQLKSWDKCQRKFELDIIKRLAWPSDPKNFRLGKGVHQLLDYDSRQMPLDNIVACADEDIVSYFKQLKASRWAQLPVIASEWGFSLGLAGRWVYGRIDRIVRDGDAVVILDWKTGTSIPRSIEQDWQTLVYLYALYEAQHDLQLSLTVEQLAMTYVQVNPRGLDHRTVSYSQAMHDDTRQRLIATFEAIEHAQHHESFKLPSECPDRYCPYRTCCGILAVESTRESLVSALE